MTANALRSPKDLLWVLLAVCCAPLVLNRFGVDFGIEPFAWQHKSLVHSLLLWTSVSAAALAAVLAAVIYRVTRDPVVPVVGLALVASASFDLFHMAAAQRLMRVQNDSADLLPFTWAIARCGHALVPAIGALFLLMRGPREPGKGRLFLLSVFAIAIAVGAWVAVSTAANTAELPQTIYLDESRPFGIVVRPFDLAPLVITVGAALLLYPRLHRRAESVFSQALWMTAIPFIAMQSHFAFGSEKAFDNDFVIGHFLLVITALVPLSAMALSFSNTFASNVIGRQRLDDMQLHLESRRSQIDNLQEELQHDVTERHRIEAELREAREALQRVYQTTYASTHDLQEPLREIMHISEALQRDLGDDLPQGLDGDLRHIERALRRMDARVQAMLTMAEPAAQVQRRELVSLRECVDRALEQLAPRLAGRKVRFEYAELPDVWGDRNSLIKLYQAMLDHALRRASESSPRIAITAQAEGDRMVYGVRDNGTRPETSDLAEFFAASQPRGGEPGLLEVCRRVIEQHRGTLWIEPQPRTGCHVRFTLEERSRAEA